MVQIHKKFTDSQVKDLIGSRAQFDLQLVEIFLKIVKNKASRDKKPVKERFSDAK